MTAKIAAALALLLALAGWGLYQQIKSNGALKTQIEERDRKLQEAASRVDALAAELKARDEAVILLEAQIDDLRTKASKIRTVIRKIYVQPEVREWADTAPPPAVVDAVGAGIECLWQPAAGGGNADCGAVPAGGDDGGL